MLLSLRWLTAFVLTILVMGCTEPPQPTAGTFISEPVPLPPAPEPIVYDYDTTKWTDVLHLDSTILLDIRYATTNNFVEEQLYDCPRCLLRPVVARQVLDIHRQLRQEGFGLKMFDCYRPRPVQQRLWDKVPNASYVTPPAKGSMHNKGCAVDLTIVDSLGKELAMGTEYDFFGREAHNDFYDHPEAVLDNRKKLRELMLAAGFKPIRTEWWHFSLPGAHCVMSDMLWNCPPEDEK